MTVALTTASLALLMVALVPDTAGAATGGVPPVGITNGVAAVNGSVPPYSAGLDHVVVKEGDVVTFRVDATNNGSAVTGNAVGITALHVWDVLPAGITCASVSVVSDGGACTDPGSADHPTFVSNAVRSAIRWAGDPDIGNALAAGATRTLTFAVTIPDGVSVSTVLTSTSAVRSFAVAGDAAEHYPSANIDTSIPVASYDSPAATDDTDVYLANVTVTNGVTSAVREAGNVGAEATPQSTTQATIGEQVMYTLTARLPAHSTVYNASFSHPLRTGLVLTSATATYLPDAAAPTTAPLPSEVTFSAAAPTATLTFPTTYDNTTDTDQLFTINMVASMAQLASNQHGVVRNTTTTFSSTTAASGGNYLPARTANASVTDVEPATALTKTNNSAGGVAGGQVITYTLKASNGAGRPPLHDGWEIDCLPGGMTFGAYGALPAGVVTAQVVPGDGNNGCPANTSVLAWNVGDLAGGTAVTLTYTATVDTSATGKMSLFNMASLTGNSLAGARTSPSDGGNPWGRQSSAGATSTVTAAGATAQASVAPALAPVGETVTYTDSVFIPARVAFYTLSIIDQLPAGIDPNSVIPGSVTCTRADSSSCSLAAIRLSGAAGTGSSTLIGWLLGDVGSDAQARTATITYTARVADVPAATAGATLTSSTHVGWDNAARTAPTSSGAAFQQLSSTATAALLVLEPGMTIAASVSRTHPEPGQSLTYSLLLANRNTSATSAAYNITATQSVPSGLVVDPSSISGGGTIAGADPVTGGGTMSWTVAGPIARNASATALTFVATLAQSATLTAANLITTGRITGYDSLPSAGRHYTGPSTSTTIGPYFPRISTTSSTPDGSTAYVGESFRWRVNARNVGLGTAYQVGTTDTLPPNWTYDPGTATATINGAPDTSIEPTVSTTGGSQILTWTSLGTLNPSAVLVIDFLATPGAGVSGSPGIGQVVNHTNSASSSAQDATGATGNQAGAYSAGPGSAVAHIASSDLRLINQTATQPTAGGSGSWTITVANLGPNPAAGPFTVTDDFTDPTPDGTSHVHASGVGWTCQDTSPITCTATGTLASGASLPSITVAYDVDAAGTGGRTLTNGAHVTSRTSDPVPVNNSATATTTVQASPTIATADHATFTVGSAGDFTVTTTAGHPTATTLTKTGDLPAGVTFTDNGDGTATIAGTPDAAGSFHITIIASNGVAPDDTQSFTLTVNQAPDVTSVDHATFAVGSGGSFTVTTSPAADTVTRSGTLPSGISLTDNGDGTATLAGTPAAGASGAYSVSITAMNAAGSTTQSFTLIVHERAALTSAEHTTFTVGSASDFTVTTTAGYPIATTLAKTGALPAGVSFTDNGDGTATLAGTPAAGTADSYPLTITAANSAGESQQSFTLTVVPAPAAPVIMSADHAAFAYGSAGDFSITTMAGYPAATTITKTGALPAGVSFTDNGDGTATVGGTATASGTFVITITASNGTSASTAATQSFSLTVTKRPAITSPDHATLTVGSMGDFTVTTTAGYPTATMMSKTGALPAGVSFTDDGDGTATVGGAPTVSGTFVITITAANDASTDATQSLSLTVTKKPLITSADHATLTVGTPAGFTVIATGGYPTATMMSKTGALPTGVGYTDNGDGTASLAGTPATGTAGSYSLSITAANAAGSTQQSFTLTVDLAGVPTVDTRLRVTATKGLVLRGKRTVVKATGLNGSEPYSIRIGRVVVATGVAAADGTVIRTVRVPGTTVPGRRTVKMTGSAAGRVGTTLLRVVRPRTLGLVFARVFVPRWGLQHVTVYRLAPGERVTVTLSGKRVSPPGAHANARGVYRGTFNVGFGRGTRAVRATGRFASRTATKTFSVIRRTQGSS